MRGHYNLTICHTSVYTLGNNYTGGLHGGIKTKDQDSILLHLQPGHSPEIKRLSQNLGLQ